MSDYKPDDGITINFRKKRISVRTEHGASAAKKMARLRLFEERINAKDLITVTISRTSKNEDNPERIFIFEW